MKKVSSVELKAHLGKYLGMIKEGKTVYVTSHRRTVAQLSPSRVDESLSIRPPTKPMKTLKDLPGVRPSSGVNGLEELLADRGRG